MSPISASAAVLKTAMAMPDSPISIVKNRKESPARNANDAAAKSVRPATRIGRRPKRSASCPRNRPASAMPPIVAY